MGRLLYILLSLMVVAGCSRDSELCGGGDSPKEITFVAGSITRGATIKESWSVGEEVAIFVADGDGVYSDVPYCYEIIDQSGAMDASAESIYNDGGAIKFCAFYPYDSALSSYGDYVAREGVTDASVDCMESGEAVLNGGVVEFQFSHIYSLLTFDFMWGYQFTDSDAFDATLGIGESQYVLDVVDMEASIFVVPTPTISDAKLSISITSTAETVNYRADLTSVTDITEWVKGEEHRYENIVVGTADLSYNSQSEVYEIFSAKGMKAFAELVNGEPNSGSAAIRDAAHSFGVANPDIDAKLMNNINLSEVCSRALGVSWTPIGKSVSNPYEGSFDGNNKYLYQLYIEDAVEDNQALFGYIRGAQIRDLAIVDGLVDSDGWYVGGLVAYAGGGSLINGCYYTGNVKGSYTVGGVVGQANGAVIISSYSSATVYAENNYVGGLIGQVASGGAVLYGCYSSSAVECNVAIGDKGGIIGEISSGSSILLDGCYFWYGADATLASVGEANNTLNIFQQGYSKSELNSADVVDDLNSAVNAGIGTLSTTVTCIYKVGASAPELILKR